MSELIIRKAIALFPVSTFIQWDVLAPENGAYLFSVYRSGSPNGPWTLLDEHIENALNYVDNQLIGNYAQLGKTYRPYYKVTAITPSGETLEALSITEPQLPTPQGGPQKMRRRDFHFGLRRKIRRDETIMFRKLNGVPAAILKKKHWGSITEEPTYDPITGVQITAHSTSTYGTKFEGGYWDPIYTLCRRSASPINEQQTSAGREDTAFYNVTMLDYPYVEPDDLLVILTDNSRYEIKSRTPTQLKMADVHQKLVVSELARSATEYQYPIDLAAAIEEAALQLGFPP